MSDAPGIVRRGRRTTEGVLTEQLHPGASGARAATGLMASKAAESGATLALVLASLDDDKAEDVLSIDLRGRSPMTDHMVIATGRSSRQVTAMAEHLEQKFKERHGRSPRIEGREVGDWVLIDCGDVVVHLFRPEVRDFYQLEKMWAAPAELRADLRRAASA